jgi:hypothetical protein
MHVVRKCLIEHDLHLPTDGPSDSERVRQSKWLQQQSLQSLVCDSEPPSYVPNGGSSSDVVVTERLVVPPNFDQCDTVINNQRLNFLMTTIQILKIHH